MRFRVLASDYDGTLATHGEMHTATADALRRVGSTGRTLVLVTGRTLDGLAMICPEYKLFDLVVAENGAVVFTAATRRTELLAEPLPDDFARVCRENGVRELHLGQVIAATWGGFREGVEAAIAQVGGDLRLSTNKGSLMILPAGVDKASGLLAALDRIGARADETVALGDAENDLSMFDIAGCAVAVGNALDEVKERADIVTVQTHGEGASEVLLALADDDLATLFPERAGSRQAG